MEKSDTIAVDPMSIELINPGDDWQLYKHALLHDNKDFTLTLCHHRINNSKIFFYRNNIDCPYCIGIIELARSRSLRFCTANNKNAQ